MIVSKPTPANSKRRGLTLIAVLLIAALCGSVRLTHEDAAATAPFIIQGETAAAAEAAVTLAGGSVTHNLAIIHAVGARLTAAQAKRLSDSPGLRLTADTQLEVAGPVLETMYPQLVDARALHELGITGAGVTIAFVDTGMFTDGAFNKTPDRTWRVLAQYDALTDIELTNGTSSVANDGNGHGSHVTSIAISSAVVRRGNTFNGVAPAANLVSVKALNDAGFGTYGDVIRGLDWILAHKDPYNIRVVNLSFSGNVQSYYWDDPLNQAVMRLWEAGVVVVAAAGNRGPDAMTIGVPGNVPYIITVGAMSDNYTPDNTHDDRLASFSSAGPTVEAFVKPDLVAPGGHLLGIIPNNSELALTHPEDRESGNYFSMSGTSQAAAVVTGITALMLQADPALSPDDVKCRLLASAHVAVDEAGLPAYSIFQQGAGLVNAYDAVFSSAAGCANNGVDIAADLAGTQHFQGAAAQDAAGNYYLTTLQGDGYFWSDGHFWSDGYFWSDGHFWSDGTFWSDGHFWSDSIAWSEGHFWSDSVAWSAAITSVDNWVPQE